jgi:hypothetical protein
VRYKNWKMYFAIAPENATGFMTPGVQTQFVAGMVNLKRDPFETGSGEEKKANFWFSGALAEPVTGYIYAPLEEAIDRHDAAPLGVSVPEHGQP